MAKVLLYSIPYYLVLLSSKEEFKPVCVIWMIVPSYTTDIWISSMRLFPSGRGPIIWMCLYCVGHGNKNTTLFHSLPEQLPVHYNGVLDSVMVTSLGSIVYRLLVLY